MKIIDAFSCWLPLVICDSVHPHQSSMKKYLMLILRKHLRLIMVRQKYIDILFYMRKRNLCCVHISVFDVRTMYKMNKMIMKLNWISYSNIFFVKNFLWSRNLEVAIVRSLLLRVKACCVRICQLCFRVFFRIWTKTGNITLHFPLESKNPTYLNFTISVYCVSN